MTYKNYEIRLLIKLVLLFAVMTGVAWLLINKYFLYMALAIPVLLYQMYDIYKMLKKAQDELQEFVESVHYRDFSRYFNVKQAPSELQPLRLGFNEINSTFKVISKE